MTATSRRSSADEVRQSRPRDRRNHYDARHTRSQWCDVAISTAGLLDCEPEAPLWIDHMPPFGLIDRLGVIRHYARVSYPVQGVLGLGEIETDSRGIGDSILHDLRLALSQRYFGSSYAFSVSALVDPKSDQVVPTEISITLDPACHDAKVLAVGSEALDTWELLTEKRAAAA
jgi:hypothetical protein